MSIFTNDPSVVELANLAFVNYKGKKYKVDVSDHPISLESYWSGGSRDYHHVVKLSTKQVVEVPQNGTMFDKKLENKTFPCPDYAVITHSIFQGKDLGITISIHPDNMNQLILPEKTIISFNELIVLCATKTLKNTYGGRTNIRFTEANYKFKISNAEWAEAVQLLITKGMLNKAGAITNSGRNVLEEYEIRSFHSLSDMKYDQSLEKAND